MGLLFLITYFLSFDAMVISVVPGAIAFVGSTLGMAMCGSRLCFKQEKKNGK